MSEEPAGRFIQSLERKPSTRRAFCGARTEVGRGGGGWGESRARQKTCKGEGVRGGERKSGRNCVGSAGGGHRVGDREGHPCDGRHAQRPEPSCRSQHVFKNNE